MPVPRDWLLEDTGSGWVLTVETSGFGLGRAPGYYGASVARVGVVLVFLVVLGINAPNRWMLLAVVSLGLIVAALLVAMLHPGTMGVFGGAPRQVVTLRNGVLETDGGFFDAGELSTLRVAAADAPHGRVLLQFTSHTMPNVDLVAWPGVPEGEAAALLAEVASHSASWVDREGANKRIELTARR